jgi:ribosomal protein S6--L-glutamate ligase
MTVVDHGHCVPTLHGKESQLLYQGKPLDMADVSIPRIGANLTARGVAILRQLDVLSAPHILRAEALQLARDKMSCLQRLSMEGVAVPLTVLCFSAYDARQSGSRMGRFPVVVKLLESTHGVGVALAHNPQQLQRIAESFLQLQDRILVQEYVRESKGRDVRAFVVGDRIVAAMERTAAAGDFRANIHRGGRAKSIELSSEDQQIVLRTACIVGVEVAGIDLIQSARGKLVMEVNASPGLEGIEGATGVDIAGAIVRYAEQKL